MRGKLGRIANEIRSYSIVIDERTCSLGAGGRRFKSCHPDFIEAILIMNKIQYFLLFVIFLVSCDDRIGQPIPPETNITYKPGNIYGNPLGHIKYLVGNTPIVISIPHGGSLTPSTIPVINPELYQEINTKELSERLVYHIFELTGGKYPHVIYSNVHPSHFNVDTTLVEGTANNTYAVQGYTSYHSFLETAVDTVLSQFPVGFLIDLHAENSHSQEVEIGYGLSKVELDLTNGALNEEGLQSVSTIQQYVQISSSFFSDIIRGGSSLGSKISSETYYYVNPGGASTTFQFDVVPGVQIPQVHSDYKLKSYTSKLYHQTKGINSFTLSFPVDNSINSAAAYNAFAFLFVKNLRSAVLSFTQIDILGE